MSKSSAENFSCWGTLVTQGLSDMAGHHAGAATARVRIQLSALAFRTFSSLLSHHAPSTLALALLKAKTVPCMQVIETKTAAIRTAISRVLEQLLRCGESKTNGRVAILLSRHMIVTSVESEAMQHN